ncbi:MAG: DHHA1 domain-containing protein [Candidatus Bilamarchaeaceae archaeon]
MKQKNLLNLLRRIKSKKVVITTHRKADVDAVASAFAISELLDNPTIAFHEDPDEGARQLIEFLKIQPKELGTLNPLEFDWLIVVDASSSALVKASGNWKIFLVIDHHAPEGRDIIGEYNIIEPDAPATSEMIANRLYQRLSKNAAFALACGIVSDTARFKSGRMETFYILSKLMKKCGALYAELLKYAEPTIKRSEQIAILKGFQRLQIFEIGEYVIVATEVGSSASDVASHLADVANAAFAADWKENEGETRMSARASREFPVPLNVVMAKTAERLGGMGGGHKKAAGCSVKGKKPDEVLAVCIQVLRELIPAYSESR